ncbi:MAG: hypothetical protein HPY74_10110 [Firmicutes bacterium]|nr:hypothetical protein [Bacillota bacterium]
MTHREKVIAVIKGEKINIIPSLGECPMDVTVLKNLLPKSTGNVVKDQINFATFFDNSAVDVGIGINQKTISRDETHHKYMYETGSVWLEKYVPTFCREALQFPINSPEEAFTYKMPDANEEKRLDHKEMCRIVKAFHDAGYFVQGSVIGAWGAIYYYLTSFENILMWMAIEPEAAQAIFNMTKKFSLDSAKRLLECGVDCIFTVSDLGSGNSLLFSRNMFYEYVFPWLKELADLCHSYGAYLHLHSHGHIQDVMDGIVEAGVDIINPIGPSDHNDLAMFKERWGDKITIHGGISTTISHMTEQEMRDHIFSVIEIGRKGGRFFPRTESGIPPMSVEKTMAYINILKEARQKGYI